MKIPSTFMKADADYISEGIKPPKQLYRFDSTLSGHNDRFYFEVGRKKIYPYISLTSLINNTLAKSFHFYRWVADKGDQAEKIKAERAIFGTVLHAEAFRPLVDNKGYSFDKLKEKDRFGISNYQKLYPKQYWEVAPGWYYAFSRSLLSFWQFVKERVIKVLAVEIPLRSRKYGYAGTLDLVCIIMFQGKPRFAIIDLKSFFFTLFTKKESKQFFDSHRLQLELQKQLWVENFGYPELEGEEVNKIYLFNFAPNNWRDKPTYTLENQTKNKFASTVKIGRKVVPGWRLHLAQAKLYDLPKPPSKTVDIVGSFDSFDNFNWEDHVLNIQI